MPGASTRSRCGRSPAACPPDEEWVTLRYVPLFAPGMSDPPAPADYTQPWLVFQPGQGSPHDPSELLAEATAVGLDDHTDDIQQVRKLLFAPQVAEAERRSRSQFVSEEVSRGLSRGGAGLASRMPGVLQPKVVRRSGAAAGDTGVRLHPDLHVQRA